MLVFGRKPGERIVIGDDVYITILGVKRDGTVRVGIDAPRDIAVDREEVRLQVRVEGRKVNRNTRS